MEVVASLSQGRTAAAQCGLFTHKSVPVTFEPPCILCLNVVSGPGSSVCIEDGYGLDCPGIELCVAACGIMHPRCCRPLAGNFLCALYLKL